MPSNGFICEDGARGTAGCRYFHDTFCQAAAASHKHATYLYSNGAEPRRVSEFT